MALLTPTRRPRSGAASRHVPVRAFATTLGAHLELESGLEHDLFRLLDRDANVTCLAAQPFQLAWRTSGRKPLRRHTPDLLSVDSSGMVTVWDVKREVLAEADSFILDREVTEQACREVGWAYEVFTGLPPVHRHNLLWLHAYRRPPTCLAERSEQLLRECTLGPTLGALFARVSDEDRALLWHMIWSGQIMVDLTARLGPESLVVV